MGVIKDIMEGAVKGVLGFSRDSFCGWFNNKRKKRRKLLEPVLERIRKELPNFELILKGEPSFNSPAHKKAVTETPFELLLIDIEKLKKVWKYKKLSMEVIPMIKEKNVEKLLPLLKQLKSKIEKETG